MTELYLAKLKEIYNGYNCERIMVVGTVGVHDTRLEQLELYFLVEIISDWES